MTEAISDLKYWCKGEPSECGKRVAKLLAIWAGGSHHLPMEAMKKCDWQNSRFVEVRADSILTGGGLSTFDFKNLTDLVFLAHDHCIRVDISPGGSRQLKIMFHPRLGRGGGMSVRHPTLEQAVSDWRSRNKLAWAEGDEWTPAEKPQEEVVNG